MSKYFDFCYAYDNIYYMSEGQEGGSNRGLVILLSVLCFVICGFVAGIVVVANNNKLVLNTCEEAINYMFENSDMDNTQTLIDAGDRALNVAPDDEVKWCIYSKRFGALYNYSASNDNKYIEQILYDAYAADGLSPDANTAYSIYMAEALAGNTEKANEWLNISEERGINNMPGKG